MRELNIVESEVKYTISAQEDDRNPYEEFSGPDNEPARNFIRKQLAKGNVWGWCEVTVMAEYKGYKGYNYLCGCSYLSEADFCTDDGYFPQMKQEALADLKESITKAITKLEEAGLLPKTHLINPKDTTTLQVGTLSVVVENTGKGARADILQGNSGKTEYSVDHCWHPFDDTGDDE